MQEPLGRARRPNSPKITKLSKRLTAVAELVRPNSIICDVGTDHALLPCFLAENGLNSAIYACDINEAPLLSAKAEIERRGLTGLINLVQSDGLSNIPIEAEIAKGNDFDAVIAGMGGELILDIIAKCAYRESPNLAFILQPMTKHEVLRKGLNELNVAINREVAVHENGKVFIIMRAGYNPEASNISEMRAFIGTSGDMKYIETRLAYLRKLSRGDAKYLELIAEIEARLPDLKGDL